MQAAPGGAQLTKKDKSFRRANASGILKPVKRVTEAEAFIWFVAFCHPCYGFPYLFLSYEGFRPPALTLVGLYPIATIFHPLPRVPNSAPSRRGAGKYGDSGTESRAPKIIIFPHLPVKKCSDLRPVMLAFISY